MRDRPEHVFLIETVRSAIRKERPRKMTPDPNFEWGYFLALADRHGVLPCVGQRLAGSRAIAIAAQNLSRAHLLRDVVALLESQGIPVIPFKGPALALLTFGDLAMRQFDDLDLFVWRDDVERAWKLLARSGYRPLEPRFERAFGPAGMHVQFEHEQSRTIVEVHWKVAPRRFGMCQLEHLMWESPARITIAGYAMRTVSPHVLLLILCIHGARHEWRRLSWICDIVALVCRHPELEWPRLRDEARRTGTRRLLYLGLDLATHLLGTAIPRDLAREVARDSTCRALAHA